MANTSKAAERAERVELRPPPYRWISWAVLLAYLAIFAEGVWLNLTHENTPEGLTRLGWAQVHLCSIYFLEAAMAVALGWCAMSPGWTCMELLSHHLPYATCAGLTFLVGGEERWSAPLLVVLLTPLNEGLFIAVGLGAPQWVAKGRRLFGFCIIVAQLYSEFMAYMRMMVAHWALGGRQGLINAMIDSLVWGGIYYHAMLLKMYIKRWTKTRSL